MNETIRVILQRSSVRKYSSEPLNDQQIDALKKVALASPSAKNRQPWHFSFITQGEVIEQMEQIMANDTNQDPYGNMKLFYKAPLVVVISTNSMEHMQLVDCGIAVENLAIAAKSMGLDSVIVGRPRHLSPEAMMKFTSLYQQPQGYEFAIAISIGYGAAGKEPHGWDYSKINVI